MVSVNLYKIELSLLNIVLILLSIVSKSYFLKNWMTWIFEIYGNLKYSFVTLFI
jgi:hypothetical protein